MAGERKEIDLVIRAALQGKNNLTDIAKSIAELEKAIDKQSAAAKRGESSIDELKATLLQLQIVQDRLKDQAGLVGQFNDTSKAVAKAADRAKAASLSYETLNEKLKQSGVVTEKQQDRLVRLAVAQDKANQASVRQVAYQQTLVNSLTEAGIAMDDLAGSETRVRAAAAQLGTTILRTTNAIESYAADVRAARDAERELADTAAFNKKVQDASNLVKASEYVNFWEKALKDADIAQDKLATNNALRKAADEAVAAARGYRTLATAMTDVNRPSISFKDTIQGIINPTSQARQTLQGLEKEVGDVAAKIASIKGPISDYREQVQRLRDIQKSISGQASIAEGYQRQVVALREARTEYVNARADVLQYAQALRQADGANSELEAGLRTAQVRLEASAKGLQAQVVQTRALRQSAREAGLATNDLAANQQRLITATRTSVTAMQQLSQAQARYGDSAKRAAEGNTFFNNSGRTSLSLLQRIRGEVLSLAAAYVGIYGAVQGAGSAIEAFNTRQALANQLALSVGNDPTAIAAEFEYIRGQADRIGVSFEVAAKGYAKFSAAASLAGRDAKEIRFIFESFTEVARVANLSNENLEGVFKALEQIISKGKIQAEELRGQLGDRLFGAFQIAAKALKDQFPDLDKALKNGVVTSEQLVAIAEEYRRQVADQLPAATKSLAAQQDRLNTALFDFKLLIADSGFAAEYEKLIGSLIVFFNSDDGANFAKDIGVAFAALAQGLLFLLNNIELVKTSAKIMFEIFAAKTLIGLGTNAVTTAVKLKQLATNADLASVAVTKLHKAFILLSIFMAAFEFAKYAADEFEPVGKLTIDLASRLERLKLKLDAFYALRDISLAPMADEFKKLGLAIGSAFARGIGQFKLADTLDKLRDTIKNRAGSIADETKKLQDKLKLDLAKVDVDEANALKDLASKFNPAIKPKGKPGALPTANPGTNPNIKTGPTEEELAKAAAKRVALKERLENELTSIESRIEKNEKDNLERRIASIDLQYKKLLNDIRKLGGPDGAEFEVRLTRDVNALKLQETKKFNDALLKEQESLQTKIEAVEVASGKKSVTDLDSRLNAIKVSYADFYREIAAAEATLVENGRDTSNTKQIKARLDAGILELQNSERKKFLLDELARRESAVNDLIEQRANRIRAVNDEEKAGLLTDSQARVAAAEVVKQMQPQIEQLTNEALAFATNFQGAIDPVKLELFVSAMNLAAVSGSRLNTELFTAASLAEMLANGASTAFDNATQSIGNAIVGTESWGDAIENVARSFGQFAADFLRQIAMMIIKQQLLNLLQSSGGQGGFLGGIADSLNGLVLHSGGVVGKNNNRSRAVPAEWFTNAPRYHAGGIAGLAPNEVPAILQRNEEVLRKDDPRNSLNGGGAKSEAAPAGANVRIINTIDPNMAGEFLQSSAGEQVIMNYITKNKNAVKAALS